MASNGANGELVAALGKAKHHLQAGKLNNKGAIQLSVVRPILGHLGWDPAEPDHWQTQYLVGSHQFDEALFSHQGKPLIFVQVRQHHHPLEEGAEESIGVAASQQVPFLVCTDDQKWDLYLTTSQRPVSDRKFQSFDIEFNDEDTVAADLVKYLSPTAVRSGTAEQAATAAINRFASRQEIDKLLSWCWRDVLIAPRRTLRNQLISDMQAKLAVRNQIVNSLAAEVDKFLRQQSAAFMNPNVSGADGDGPAPNGHNESGLGFKFYGISIANRVHPLEGPTVAYLHLVAELQATNGNILQQLENRYPITTGTSPRTIFDTDSRFRQLRYTDKQPYTQVPKHAQWYLYMSDDPAQLSDWMQEVTELAGKKWGKDVVLLYTQR
ncbi:hypothetical protein [Candidatus Poriferisodalis sp.]|uniref:hypothetical protein n=1 Tax=Candidatus Poriferisodalis sp. TaxID=3101277 RepID=UPI003B0283AB